LLDTLNSLEGFKVDRLWAPWRIEYILSEKEEGCLFCRVINEDRDDENLILYRGKKAYVILNKYPYNNGHLMIVPYRHVPNIEDLDDDELLEICRLTTLSIRLLKHVMKPEGFNIGANIGKAAGAGIEEHFHLHIVPRWVGDTNFMPIISDTKVVVEAIKETYKKLKKGLKEVI